MFRNDTTAGSPFVDMVATAGEGVSFQWRSTAGGSCNFAQVTGINTPVWVELVRDGDGSAFSGYYSSNGTTWTQVGAAQAIVMNSTVQAGLAVTAHDNGVLNTAAFSNVSVAPAEISAISLTPPPSAVAGTATPSQDLLHFSDTKTVAAANFTATITWGDGTTSTGNVVADGANFNVTGSHTYADALSGAPFQIAVTDNLDGYYASFAGTVSVADAGLTAGAVSPPTGAVVGTATASKVLFHFSDANPLASAGDFTATIAWGDGSTSTVSNVADSDGCQIMEHIAGEESQGFDVIGSYTYGETLSAAPFSVEVSDSDGASVTSGAATVTVSASPLQAGTLTPPTAAVAGTATSSQTLLYFTDGDSTQTIADFTAAITWGDGATSTATSVGGGIVASGSGYDVVGSHIYAEPMSGGDFEVDVADADGHTTAHEGTVNVADAALTAGNATPQTTLVYAGRPTNSSHTLFTFNDANTLAVAGDFTATITWGDGTTSTGTVVADGSGAFSVTGPHTYGSAATIASGAFGVSVTDSAGTSTSATYASSFAVATPELSGTANALSGTAGTAITDQVLLSFSDGNASPAPVTADITATIDWGDGSQTTGVTSTSSGCYIVKVGAHSFEVVGSHTYAEALSGGTYEVERLGYFGFRRRRYAQRHRRREYRGRHAYWQPDAADRAGCRQAHGPNADPLHLQRHQHACTSQRLHGHDHLGRRHDLVRHCRGRRRQLQRHRLAHLCNRRHYQRRLYRQRFRRRRSNHKRNQRQFPHRVGITA